ncbi:MAG: hypothetical protein MI748_01520, partial [Opitutales bacterium]|nr:hypothetical protein [Opitutales bacterium]
MKLLSIITLSLLILSQSYATKRVSIKSEASLEFQSEQTEVQTYHLVQGSKFTGRINDKGLENYEFLNIAKTLVPSLQKSGFEPLPVSEQGDLMIVVYWGRTATFGNPSSPLDINDPWQWGNLDYYSYPKDLEESYELVEDGEKGKTYRGRHLVANILGFSEILNSTNVMPSDQLELIYKLRRSQYFVALLAYDYPKYLKYNEMDLKWVTRLSMNATNIAFEDALPNMILTASGQFGTNMDPLDIQTKRIDNNAEVIFGELEFLGMEEDIILQDP